jgi:hypothetical protein
MRVNSNDHPGLASLAYWRDDHREPGMTEFHNIIFSSAVFVVGLAVVILLVDSVIVLASLW